MHDLSRVKKEINLCEENEWLNLCVIRRYNNICVVVVLWIRITMATFVNQACVQGEWSIKQIKFSTEIVVITFHPWSIFNVVRCSWMEDMLIFCQRGLLPSVVWIIEYGHWRVSNKLHVSSSFACSFIPMYIQEEELSCRYIHCYDRNNSWRPPHPTPSTEPSPKLAYLIAQPVLCHTGS